MNKILRYSFMSLLMLVCGSIFAQDATIKFADIYGTQTIPGIDQKGEKVVGDITLTFAKGNSNTAPAYNKAEEIRLYGGGSETKMDGNTFVVKAKKNMTSR